jgi:hypothetical protein
MAGHVDYITMVHWYHQKLILQTQACQAEPAMRARVHFAVPADCIRGTTEVTALTRMTRPTTAEDEKKQRRDEGDQEQQCQVGQAPFQPLRPNSPGSEEDLVEVENPKGGRDDEQANADGRVGEMQNDVIIHDGFIGSGMDAGSPPPPGDNSTQAMCFVLRTFPHQTAVSSGRLSIFDNSSLICTSRLSRTSEAVRSTGLCWLCCE